MPRSVLYVVRFAFLISSVILRVLCGESFCFPISRDVGDDPIPAILQPSACILQPDPHPGISNVVLKTNAKLHFDSLMTGLSKLFLGLLLPLIWLIAKC